MQARLRRQKLSWNCPDCGEVEDYIVELSVEGRVRGRWFQDGHFGQGYLTNPELEFRVCQLLAIDFQALERLREARVRAGRSSAGLDADFVVMLRQEGVPLVFEEETLVSESLSTVES